MHLQLESVSGLNSKRGTAVADVQAPHPLLPRRHPLQEYAALKQQLLDNTRKSGGAIGAYLLLTVNGTAALLAMIGAGASYGYLMWLCRDVDAVQGTDVVPIWEANKVCCAAAAG